MTLNGSVRGGAAGKGHLGGEKGSEQVEMVPRDGAPGQLPRPPLHPLPTRPSFSDRLPIRPSELLKVRARLLPHLAVALRIRLCALAAVRVKRDAHTRSQCTR